MAFKNIQATRFPIFQFRLKWQRAAASPTKGTRATPKKTRKKLFNLILFSCGRLRNRKPKKWSTRFRGLKVALNHLVKRFSSKLAGNIQDLVCAAQTASLCSTVKEKETIKELVTALKKLEEEYRKFYLSKTYIILSSDFAFYLFSSEIQVFVQLKCFKV